MTANLTTVNLTIVNQMKKRKTMMMTKAKAGGALVAK